MTTDSLNRRSQTYQEEIAAWRQVKEDSLRRDDGWLTLVGLFWLHEGRNSVGGRADSDITLPATGLPEDVAILEFHDGVVSIHVVCDEPVIIDGLPAKDAVLRDDTAENGPSLVTIQSITFFVIKRGDEYGIRVRDSNNPALISFTGRTWFAIDPTYRVHAKFTAYPSPRSLPIMSVVGVVTPMENPGSVEFVLKNEQFHLEAFNGDEGALWFVFRDQTSGHSTYGAARFLTAPLSADGSVDLDFNKAYNPPCAFTHYATCPLPPKGNILAIAIEAGETV